MTASRSTVSKVAGALATMAAALLVGVVVVRLPVLGLILAGAGAALAVLWCAPRLGLYLSFPAFVLLPVDRLRVPDFPFLNSPLDVLVSVTAGVALLQFLIAGRRPAKSPLYVPLALCTVVILVNVAARNPEVGLLRLSSLLLSTWPFVLTVLLVERPSHASRALLSVLASFAVFTIIWLPHQLSSRAVLLDGGGPAFLRVREMRIESFWGALQLNYMLVLAFATAMPLLVSVAWSGRKIRIWVRLAAGATAVAVMAMLFGSGFLVASMGGVFGCAAVPAVRLLVDRGFRGLGTRLARLVPRIAVALALVAFLLPLTPQGAQLLDRMKDPKADVSGNIRLYYFEQGARAFLQNPLLGYGPFNEEVFRGGYVLGGHNSYIMPAYEYGLVYLVPFLWLLAGMVRLPLRVGRRATRAVDKALAVGIASSVLSVLFMGALTEVFNGVVASSVLWFAVGLATVWDHWLDVSPGTPLVGPIASPGWRARIATQHRALAPQDG